MADTQDQPNGCTSLKKKARKTVNSSTKDEKCQRSPKKLVRRTRVTIGLAFPRWRELKAAHGLRTDADVALHLLDAMKKSPSPSASSGASDKKIRFSQSEVQALVEQEVRAAMKNKERKLQRLLETIEKLDNEVDYESSIQKLEARINMVNKRAQAALAYMRKKKSPVPSPVNKDVIRSDSDNESLSHNKESMEFTDKSGGLFQMMETTKKAVQKMQANSKALRAARADLSEERPPPVLSPYGFSESEGLVRVIKKEPEDLEEKENNVEKPKAERVKAEPVSPAKSNPKDKFSCPPLPSTTFPSILSLEAASYNIPQRPEVRLALIRNPPSLSVLWTVSDADPSAPPMESYSVYLSVEKCKGSGIFPKWNTIGAVEASPLPMCVMINHYKPGRKVCVAVVGKDKFGRYGPYSEVVTAAIPE